MHSSSPERCVQGERMQAHNINYNNKNYCNIVSCSYELWNNNYYVQCFFFFYFCITQKLNKIYTVECFDFGFYENILRQRMHVW